MGWPHNNSNSLQLEQEVPGCAWPFNAIFPVEVAFVF
jgi:hypothetical protein